MSTLVVFSLLALTLAVVLALIVLTPWLRVDKTAQYNQLISLNIEVFQERIAELDQDYQAGVIDKAGFIDQKTELERQLLQANADNNAIAGRKTQHKQTTPSKVAAPNRRSRLILWVFIPLLIGLGYLLMSDSKTTTDLWTAQDTLGQVADDLLTGKIEAPPEWATKDNIALFTALQMNVYRHAEDAGRWVRLADIFMAFEAGEPAFEAMSRAYRLQPNDTLVATRFAQVQFFTQGGKLNAESRVALQNVLQQNPTHQGAQILMVMGEAQAGNFAEAQQWVKRLRASISEEGGDQSVALASLDEMSATIEKQKQNALMASGDNSNVGGISPTNPINETNLDSQVSSDTTVVIVLSINPSLLPLLEPNDILFVTVKAAAGGPPLAAKRLPINNGNQFGKQLANEGLTLQLSDQDAMMAQRTISSAVAADTPLVVTAHISKSGQAISKAGDLTAIPVPITDLAEPIHIVIAEQMP